MREKKILWSVGLNAKAIEKRNTATMIVSGEE